MKHAQSASRSWHARQDSSTDLKEPYRRRHCGMTPHWQRFSTRGAWSLTVGEGMSGPSPPQAARMRPGRGFTKRTSRCDALLVSWCKPGTDAGVPRLIVMASLSPRCEIRQLALFVYPGGVKAPNGETITVVYGRRGKQVKKPVSSQMSAVASGPASTKPGASAPRRSSEPRGLRALGIAPADE
jgi:hypothetical protein